MRTLESILIATDFSECGDAALSYAFTLAASVGAKVHLLHAFTLHDMLEARAPDHEALADADAWAERRLREAAARYAGEGLVGELIVTMGQLAPAVLAASARVKSDLIVIGARERQGLSGAMRADVVKRVLRAATCPVMSLRQPLRKAHLAQKSA